MTEFQSKSDWAKTLVSGDKVLTNYPDIQNEFVEVTIQNVRQDPFTSSGYTIKLVEIEEEIDLFWIQAKQ